METFRKFHVATHDLLFIFDAIFPSSNQILFSNPLESSRPPVTAKNKPPSAAVANQENFRVDLTTTFVVRESYTLGYPIFHSGGRTLQACK